MATTDTDIGRLTIGSMDLIGMPRNQVQIALQSIGSGRGKVQRSPPLDATNLIGGSLPWRENHDFDLRAMRFFLVPQSLPASALLLVSLFQSRGVETTSRRRFYARN